MNKSKNSFFKNLIISLFFLLSVNPASANPKPEIMSMESIVINNITVSLPKIKTVDGNICQSYILEYTNEINKPVTFKIAEICGKMYKISNGIGGYLYYPEQLESMQFVQLETKGYTLLKINNNP